MNVKLFFYFLQKSKMPEELTLDLDSALPSQPADFSGLLNATQMSTSSMVYSCILAVWTILCMWKVFEKAGLPGWGAIVPFYNIWLRFKLAGRSPRWILSLLFLPLFAIIMIITYFDVAKRFGKSGWFGLGLWFLNPIFMWILAFDKSTYSAK